MSEPTHEQVLEFVREHSCPFATTKEVSEEFASVSRRTINQRLNELTVNGELKKRRVGGGAVVWYLEENQRLELKSD